jgi:hypothetical protein
MSIDSEQCTFRESTNQLYLDLPHGDRWALLQKKIHDWMQTSGVLNMGEKEDCASCSSDNLQVSFSDVVQHQVPSAVLHWYYSESRRGFRDGISHTVLSHLSPTMLLIVLRQSFDERIKAMLAKATVLEPGLRNLSGDGTAERDVHAHYEDARSGKVREVTASSRITGYALPKYDRKMWKKVFG